MVREEVAGRLEVVHRDGELGHRPGPLAEIEGPPWVLVAPGLLLHPRHAVAVDGLWEVPGGWRIVASAPVPAPEPLPPPGEVIPDIGVRGDQVLYLRAVKRKSVWMTDLGPLPVNRRGRPLRSGRQAAALHPDMRPAGRNLYFNPLRLRALYRVTSPYTGHRAVLDTGEEVFLAQGSGEDLARSLGLQDPDEPCPRPETQRWLWRLGLRRWPFDLAEAPAEFLRREYPDGFERLVGDLALQAVMTLREGRPLLWGRSHRGRYYRPMRHVLGRAGLLTSGSPQWDGISFLRVDNDPDFRRMCVVLTRLVGDIRAFTYREMGFREPRAGLRLVGDRLPWVVLILEKESLEEAGRLIQERFGVSLFLSGGSPALISTEYFARRLARALDRPIRIVALCDHDPFGHDIPLAFQAQLRRYGMTVVEEIRRLVKPSRFTADEIRRLATPIDTRDEKIATRTLRWIRETGGTNGEALALLANMLHPAERVVGAFVEEMGEGLA